jgi:hypothetical protein
MKKLLKGYPSEFAPALNTQLMNKEADAPLVDYVVDAWKSLEVVDAIRIVGHEYTEKESQIDINKYILKREKKKKKKERFPYKFIADDRCGLLTIHAEITLDEKDRSGNKIRHIYPIKKDMLIPLQDDDGYYFIHGKRYYLIYQMVEKSTYTSNASVTLKSLMPIAVKRGIIDHVSIDNFDEDDAINDSTVDMNDIRGIHYQLPYYNVYVFKKEIPVILFYLKDGFDSAMDFLGVNGAIRLLEKLPNNPSFSNIYFQISNRCFLEVNRFLFNKYPFVQSIVGGLIFVSTNRCTVASFSDPKIWIKKISGTNNYDKGCDILNFFRRLLDETTRKNVKIHEYHRQDIYTLLRWMCQEFTTLRLKDNMSLDNKRLRCNELISALLTFEFSKRLNRIISLGEKATIENYRDLFKFPGDILIQKMHTSGILRFDESVNDMTFFSKFKFTNKGPNSLGGKNSNNIGIKYRGIHPSFLGNLDILVCGNSDPGTSGLLSPYGKIKGLYFDDSDEKDNFMYEFQKDLEQISKAMNITYIKLDYDSEQDFYDGLMRIQRYIQDNVKVYGTSREGHYEVVIEEEKDDSDETTIESSEAKKKSKVVGLSYN